MDVREWHPMSSGSRQARVPWLASLACSVVACVMAGVVLGEAVSQAQPRMGVSLGAVAVLVLAAVADRKLNERAWWLMPQERERGWSRWAVLRSVAGLAAVGVVTLSAAGRLATASPSDEVAGRIDPAWTMLAVVAMGLVAGGVGLVCSSVLQFADRTSPRLLHAARMVVGLSWAAAAAWMVLSVPDRTSSLGLWWGLLAPAAVAGAILGTGVQALVNRKEGRNLWGASPQVAIAG